MPLTTLVIKDGLDNVQDIQVNNVGASSQELLIPTSTPLDLAGNFLFAENNPGVVAGIGLVVAQNFVRPANTTAYASGQLIANSTTAVSVVALAMPVARFIGGTCNISRARLTKSSLSTTLATFRAHLYNLLPTPVNGDGGVWSTNQALGYCGSFTLDMTSTAARVFTDGAKVMAVPDVGTMQIIDTKTVNVIYALLEARAAYVPTSGETFTLALEVTQN